MSELLGVLLIVGLMLGLSNFAWQALSKHRDWVRASERTWFQCVALLTVALVMLIPHG